MPDTAVRAGPLASPLHAILLAFPVALFPSGLLADVTYLNTAVIQWTNFAQWLIAGAVFFTGVLVVWALASFFFGRTRRSRGRGAIYLVVLALMFVLGLINSLQHAKDGWSSVGTAGLVLSILCSVLALVAAFLAHSRTGRREART